MKRIRPYLSLGLLLLAGASSAASLTNNGQRISETLLLTADIDLSQSMLMPLAVISHTPSFQTIPWDGATRRFREMGIALRALSESNGQPLLLDILSDNYVCASVSPQANAQVAFSAINEGYRYSVEVAGRSVATLRSGGATRHTFEAAQWQYSGALSGVERHKYLLDFFLKVTLPDIAQQLPEPRAAVTCDGQVVLMVSTPLAGPASTGP
ncbi:hypothetical protein A9798_04820 [Edwardsiella hoshinae]|uniref:Uncharacterized protein n=1 Tax=Edwardsiella hoshinae TaxID=93378 RepID=A0ABM6EHF2_9GAMM|nr:hypothetical protein [Edwardsiella hoshinae]AOV96334.1 hypothetical protein A9798_04820 [Edwardsiella hoshinae]